MKARFISVVSIILAFLFVTGSAAASSQYSALGTAFTFQGSLNDGDVPANGTYDFQFRLYDDISAGFQKGSTVPKDDVTVTDGRFTVLLDFGGIFDGTAMYLEIDVRAGSSTGAYATLTPRQRLTPTPYALFAMNAMNAYSSSWSGLTDVPAGFADGVDDTGASHNHWGESWSGTGTGLTLSGGGTGASFSGYSYGVYAASPASVGVYGESTGLGGMGMWAVGNTYGLLGTGETYGVAGSAVDGIGVSGTSTHGTGVDGVSTDGTGVRGESTDGIGVFGTSVTTGVRGEGPVAGTAGRATAPGGYGIYGSSISGAGDYAGFFDGNVRIVGDSTVTGIKSAVVDTQDYGRRALYSIESPESWFEDFGMGQLTDGAAIITIEPIFAETVNLTEAYYVFVTPLSDCALYVDEKSPTSFAVHAMGTPSCSTTFDYRIVAKRLGYEDVRLAEVDAPETEAANR